MPFLSSPGTRGRQVLEAVGVGGMRLGVFPARFCLEFKFTAVRRLWDSTSRKVEYPPVEH